MLQEQIETIVETRRLLKAADVARILNISRSLVYRMLQRGKIPSIRINQSVRVDPGDLQQFIARNRSQNETFSIAK